MSVSKSETNIPKIRKPFSAELIPRVPYIGAENVGVNDTTNKLVTPVIVKNRQIVEAQQVTTKEYVDNHDTKVEVTNTKDSGDVIGTIKVTEGSATPVSKDIKQPIASTTQRGTVKVGTNINVDTTSGSSAGTISVNTANGSTLGVVKQGTNVKVENGSINVPTANGTSLGVAKQGTNVTVGSDGAISVATGSTTAKGVVKVGDNIQVSDGTIGVKHAGAGDTSKPGVLTTVKDKTVVGTDENGNLKEATKTAGSTVATKEYVDGAVVVDPKFSSGTNVADITVVGNKKEVKVPIASESTAGLIKTVKNASFVGTNANGELVAKVMKVTPTKEDWIFEALDGTTTTKSIVTNVDVTAS